MVFDFVRPSDVSKLIKRSNASIKKRCERRREKDLYEWMEMDCTDIPPEIELQLDELIYQRKMIEQSKWTIADEAERHGIDITDLTKLSMSNGLFCNPATTDFVVM